MKKVTSILVVILVITVMTHLSIANHFCGGMLAATRVSLSGQLASCGMETEDIPIPVSGSSISGRCCDDVVATAATDNNYVPSVNFILNHHQHNFQILNTALLFSCLPINHLKSLLTDVIPPGKYLSSHTDCPDICVFRI